MKTLGIFSLCSALALSVGLVSTAFEPTAHAGDPKPAKPKGKDDKKAATPAGEAPTTKKAVTISPAELAWGIDKKKLATIYDKVIEEDFKPRYQKAQPGPEMDRLDAEVAEKKSEFRRSQIDFGTVPTGVDATPLRGEYSYNNKEAILETTRAGKVRTFFFIGDKMWKIADAVKLGEKSQWGKTFDEAVGKLNAYYGSDGRSRAADAAAGRNYREVDWKDATTQVRAVDWGNDSFAIIFQDSATVSNLANLRKNKDGAAAGVDGKVKDAGRKPDATPPPKDDKKPIKKGK